MCNAWNHPADCTCGFGGEGHLGGPLSGFSGGIFGGAKIPSILSGLTSFTIPNARCPVCLAPCFYYRNAFGSSVFFDELGPPWPKHPCTDSSVDNDALESAPLKLELGVQRPTKQETWKGRGWVFYIVGPVVRFSSTHKRLNLVPADDGQPFSLIIQSHVAEISTGEVVFVKKKTHRKKRGVYLFSFLVDGSPNTIEIRARKDIYDKLRPIKKPIPRKNVSTSLQSGRCIESVVKSSSANRNARNTDYQFELTQRFISWEHQFSDANFSAWTLAELREAQSLLGLVALDILDHSLKLKSHTYYDALEAQCREILRNKHDSESE
jgi:hypothetical protein